MLRESPTPRGKAAFTIVEVSVSVAIFAYFALTSVLGMVQFNRLASINRYRTLAQVAAQQRLDQIMTTGWSISGTAPAILTTGTTTENNLPLNNDTFNAGTGLGSIYTASDTQVNATRTTKITAVSGKTRLLQAIVTVAYSYRGRNYSLTLTSMRATDDF